MKRTLSLILTLALLLSFAVTLPSIAEEKKVVTVWTFDAEDLEETKFVSRLRKWAADFNAASDTIEVQVEGGKTAEVLLTTLAAGSTPDIFRNYWNNAPAWAQNGVLLDLTEYVNNAPESWNKADFLDAAWDLCTYNGHIYSIPYSYSSSFIFYDKDLLAQEGYEFPKTLDEMIEMADKLTIVGEDGKIERMGIVPDYPWLETVMWPVAFNAPYLSEDGKTVTFDDPEMVKAYQWQADMYAKYGYDNIKNFIESLGQGGTAQDPLLTGKIVFRWSADSSIPSYMDGAKITNKNIAMAMMPAASDGNSYGMLTCGVWGVNAKTADVDATMEVLYSLTSPENMKWMANGDYNNGTFCPRASALQYVIDGEFPEMSRECAKLLLDGKFRAFPMCSFIGPYLSEINTLMTEAISGFVPVQEACEEVVENVQPLADEANR